MVQLQRQVIINQQQIIAAPSHVIRVAEAEPQVEIQVPPMQLEMEGNNSLSNSRQRNSSNSNSNNSRNIPRTSFQDASILFCQNQGEQKPVINEVRSIIGSHYDQNLSGSNSMRRSCSGRSSNNSNIQQFYNNILRVKYNRESSLKIGQRQQSGLVSGSSGLVSNGLADAVNNDHVIDLGEKSVKEKSRGSSFGEYSIMAEQRDSSSSIIQYEEEKKNHEDNNSKKDNIPSAKNFFSSAIHLNKIKEINECYEDSSKLIL